MVVVTLAAETVAPAMGEPDTSSTRPASWPFSAAVPTLTDTECVGNASTMSASDMRESDEDADDLQPESASTRTNPVPMNAHNGAASSRDAHAMPYPLVLKRSANSRGLMRPLLRRTMLTGFIFVGHQELVANLATTLIFGDTFK